MNRKMNKSIWSCNDSFYVGYKLTLLGA